jgi:hypothetical protein
VAARPHSGASPDLFFVPVFYRCTGMRAGHWAQTFDLGMGGIGGDLRRYEQHVHLFGC